ncbi:MAG: thioredoxin family protein [Chitinophagaceae bacterium]|nr:thioredoxin family protein [Chitinophagaceae bacterium]MCW5905813.1 thioredoxin family protein [Chitinophagaceae bacterium]
MKHLIIILMATTFMTSCSVTSLKSLSKENYTESRDEGHEKNAKILRGIINRSTLETDTAFNWFEQNYKFVQPNADAIKAFEKNKDKFQVIIFGGTWCEDTQNLLPLFYKLTDKSNFPANQIYLIGVDREKTTIKNLHKKYAITHVPTFIILHNGKEIDRVVEYGKTGMIDKELGEIVNKIQ